MIIVSVDPGPTDSCWLKFDTDTRKPVQWEHSTNIALLRLLRTNIADRCVFEQVAAMGMAVGAEVFETVFWTGQFVEAWNNSRPVPDPAERIKRIDIKLHLCGQARAKDANVRQSLIDMYGGKEKAIGKKKSPGPLYGISSHAWAALAVAVTYADRLRSPAESGVPF